MEKSLREHLYIVILCGGTGKRLWPRSRVKTPKQFIKLFGEATIYQQTVERAKLLVPPEKIFSVTNIDYLDEIRQQSPDIPRKNIFPEPEVKGTALAMGVAAMLIGKIDPEAVIVSFSSDQYIGETPKFVKSVSEAIEAARLGDFLVTIGVKPAFPHTGLGYIKRGSRFEKTYGNDIYYAERYVEKPDSQTAKKLVESGNYYWNTYFYTWRTSAILNAIAKYLPQTAEGINKIRKSLGTPEEKKVIAEVYGSAEKISLDDGVSEKANNLLVVLADFIWSDIGDWKVAYDISPKSEEGNVIIHEKGNGEFMGIDTKNCLVHFSDQLVATIGVEDLIIIDTRDALLITKKERSQEVKGLVNKLIETKKTKYI